MTERYAKLITLLKELFQLNQPDLDFGFYRIMHAKSAEVMQFLEKDLLPQVKAAFAQYQPADRGAIEKELAKAIEQARALGADPETLPKVKELHARLVGEAVDLNALEAEVYDHLYSFFRRYYSEGDFLSKRVYKPGVYAIPYEGEEVKLHWANADQYYIKTSEYLRDYAFRLRPDDRKNPLRVHFRLADAAEGEHGNVKEAAGKERRFRLTSATPVVVEDGELVIRFTYEPDTTKQKDLNTAAEQAILRIRDAALAEWLDALGRKHVRNDGTEAEATRLRVNLDRYTARNTFDYFIHKDLGGFLRRELDFYIKNEVMYLDDVANETAPRVEQYLSKLRVIRRIAGKIIEFLAQLEDFQKKLWLKRKFVVETQYCIALGAIPEAFYPEIVANNAQHEEWVRLFAIDEIKDDLTTSGYSVPLTVEFLKAHPTLVVDTRHFSSALVEGLLERIGASTLCGAGTLINAENENALRLIYPATTNAIKCIYIDPPFNTGDDGFLYKDNYQHSSWCCLLIERLKEARKLMAEGGVIAVSIDQEELGTLQLICDEVFGRSNRLPTITVKRGSVTGHKVVNPGVVNISEYVLCYALNRAAWVGNDIYAERERDPRYSTFIRDRDKDHTEWAFVSLLEAFGSAHGVDKRKLRERFGDDLENKLTTFVIDHADAVVQLVTVNRSGVGADFLSAVEASELRPDEVLLHRRQSHPDVYLLGGKKLIFYTDKLVKVGERRTTAERASDIWLDVLPNDLHNEGGVALPKGKKPEALVARLLDMGSSDGDLVLDFFAGTGTTPAVAQKSGRRWIAVEVAPYFDDKPVVRMKNVLFGEERGVSDRYSWHGGGAFKYIRLESYEDALNNLALDRTPEQEGLLELTSARGPDKLREQYLLRYMLDVDTRGSQSLLSTTAFTDPTAYRLKVKRPGSDESREVNVDLLETFNWLIGLTVQRIAAPQILSAAFERDSERRLRLRDKLARRVDGRWWFRTVTGTLPDGRKTLVIWRKRPSGDTPEGIEQDNLVLDEWFTQQGYPKKDSEFDMIYVNGGNNLENLKSPGDTWKVRLIEEDFHRLMFNTDEA